MITGIGKTVILNFMRSKYGLRMNAASNGKKMENLSDLDIRLLGALSENSGRLTRDVSEKAGVSQHNKRQSSGATRAWLMRLKKRGLVDFYDNEKPTVWKRTEAGTRAFHGLPPIANEDAAAIRE
jgi:hypothetical protein